MQQQISGDTGVSWNIGGSHFRSKILLLADFLMLILFLFKKCFRDLYNDSRSNPVS